MCKAVEKLETNETHHWTAQSSLSLPLQIAAVQPVIAAIRASRSIF
jgi:hypothetical protein